MPPVPRTVIYFNKKKYKSVKYEHGTHDLNVNDYIKFNYGPTENPIYHKKIIGKIKQFYNNGVGVVTDYGQFNPAWNRIDRIFVVKQNNRIKENRLKSTSSSTSAGVLDNVVDKIIKKIKTKHPELKIKDRRVDLTSRFTRSTVFSKGHKNIQLLIENDKAANINITGSNIRKSKLKTKNDKVNSQQIYFLVKRISDKLLGE